jgi:beta-N-acetylhexosaminidase
VAAVVLTAATLALLLGLAGASAGRGVPADPRAAAPRTATATPARPHIVWRKIPFGATRRAETVAYSQRHYGVRTSKLRGPHVIVEHYTVTPTFQGAWNTFASDAADPELHETPGTCAHFVVDRDGTIYQLVSIRTICRHTVGLNWTAIGIEHVGMTQAQVSGDRRQMAASRRLTQWLRCTYGIPVRDVIGHAESLASPYHREDVAALRRQTHSDFPAAAMRRYRAALGPC